MASEDINDLTKTIGDCGFFQVFLTLAVHSATVPSVWGTMFMAFGNFNPGWICLDGFLDNTSLKQDIKATDSVNLGQFINSNVTEWSLNCSAKRTCNNLVYNSDSSTIVTEWDLSCDSSWMASLIFSIQMAGAWVGSMTCGQIGDRFGRKVSLYGHFAVQGVAHIVAIFSVSWQMYAAVYFVMGFGIGGVIGTTYPFPLEFVNGWWRAVISSIPVWNISFLIFALIAYLLKNWQHLHIVAAVCSGLVFLNVFWLPESVRWLTVSGRVVGAKKEVTRIARMNGHPTPDTQVIDDIAKKEKASMGNHTYTYLDLFRISNLRGYTLKFGFIWASLAWIYYCVVFGIRALAGDFYINLILSALLEFPAILCVAPAANNLGRKKASLLFFSMEIACCFALVLFSLLATGNVRDNAILVLALISKMIIVAAWAVISVYNSEIFPTVVRSLQHAYFLGVSRIASIVAPYLIPQDPELLYVSFIVLGILGMICCAMIFSLPETKGKKLNDLTSEVSRMNEVCSEPMLADDKEVESRNL